MNQFRFTGTGREYFGIWIVNLLLTVITLGIYSAWAKVRRKRYFYGNTWLAESNFDYHGNPIAILKGRVIAFVAFVAYTLATQFSPKLGAAILLALMPAIPWLIVRSFAFNAVNSSYRNLRFHFTGRYRDVFFAIAPFFLAPAATLLLPQFDPKKPPQNPWDLWYVFVAPLILSLFYPYIIGKLRLLHINGTRYGTAHFGCRATIARFYGVYGLAGLLFIGLLVVFGVAMVPLVAAPMLAVVALPAMYLAMGAILFGYTQSRVGNLVFNATWLEERAHTVSTLSARRLAWIYAGNLFAIVLTIGLAIPWAATRTARYRADCLGLICEGGLDAFVGEVAQDVSATGEEIGTMFDLDLSL
ncbi:MAG: YjgN family protein [Usitatibacter sp.]